MLQSEKPSCGPITAATAADCLLVVDEDECFINGLRGMLGKLGFEIIPALGGQQALAYLATRVPDLILLKLLMTETDGFELCKKIQENPAWADIPDYFLFADRRIKACWFALWKAAARIIFPNRLTKPNCFPASAPISCSRRLATISSNWPGKRTNCWA